MTIRTMPFSIISALAAQPRTKPSQAASVRAQAPGRSPMRMEHCVHLPAPRGRLEMRWQMSANGPVFRWEAVQVSEADAPAQEEWSPLLLAV